MESNSLIRILFVEDVPADAELAQAILSREGLGFTFIRVDTEGEFIAALTGFKPDLIISDYSMPTFDGMRALKIAREYDADLPFILLTGSTNEEIAVACMKAGATDYVLKERIKRLPFAVNEALAQKQTRTAKEAAEHALRESEIKFRRIVEESNDGLVLIDESGIIIEWNKSIEKMTGLSKDQTIGKLYLDVQWRLILEERRTSENRARIKELVTQALRTGDSAFMNKSLEATICRADGTQTILLQMTFPIKTQKGYWIGGTWRDITDRKRAEDQLRQLSSAVEQSPASVVITDTAGNIEYVNPKFTQVTDYTYAEALGKNPRILKSGETPLAEYERLWDTITHGDVWRGDFHNKKKNGELYWESASISAITDERGAITHYVAVKEDITERKRAEENLRESSRYTRNLIEVSLDPLVTIGPDGKIMDVNHATELATGISREKLIGNDFSDYFVEPHKAREGYRQVFEKGFVRDYPLTLRHISGSALDVLYNAAVYKDAAGNVAGVFAAARDITERKRAEENLRESETRLSTVFRASPVGISITRLSDGIYVDVNPTFLAICGYTREEVVGHTSLELNLYLHPEERTNLAKTVLAQGKTQSLEIQYRRKSGEIGTVLVSAELIELDGLQCVLSMSHDITERKQRQHELEAIAQVSAALRSAHTRAEMLPIVIDQVVGLLMAQAAAFSLRDPATDESVIEIARGQLVFALRERMPAGEGVSGRVMATGQPYLNNDASTDPLITHPEALGELKAIACVPLIAEKQVIGAVWIARQRGITQDELRILTAVADIAANAIHRASLHEQTECQLERLAVLHTIDTTIASSLDVNLTFTVLIEEITTRLKVDAADILLLNPNTMNLEYRAGRGFRIRANEKIHLRMGEGYAGRAIMERRISVVTDASTRPHDTDPTLSRLRAEAFVAYYCVPLIVKAEVKGVLELFHRTPLPATAEWLDFLDTLARQAAIAIDNVELFNDLQRSTLELGLAYDSTIEGWSRAMDLRDRETEGHTQRVTEMTVMLARALGVSDKDLVHVRRGALLHDVGKVGVPDGVLLKQGELSAEEWQVMHKHPQYA
ncbi:Nitrogen fixation regulatory protein [Anaerolineae bacterium]|nr:Nitrogen fixation regulatory protein [Anaerolineae bacterium]